MDEEKKPDSHDSESKDDSEIQSLVEDKTQISIDNNPDKKFKPAEFKKTVKKNPWVMATIVLGIIALILLVLMLRGGITGNIITGRAIGGQDAGDNLIAFANAQGIDLEILEINSDGDFYEVLIFTEGRESKVTLTKDGENLVQLTPLIARTQPQITTEYSEEDLVKIKEFSQCLADNGVKAYGAGWCGYCKKLKEAFGGEEQVSPFYIECQNSDRTPTEHSELCEQEQITGFPTIKINGELYKGARTIEGLASAVEGCDSPDISV